MAAAPDLLTAKEAAALARVSRSLVYAWCDERRLAHLRAGGAGKRGRILIRRTDLEEFLRELLVERHPLLSAGG